ncbi:pyridoxal-dependent decarboxylase domain protein [Ancylostoma duodenale]|uniref:Aromatic-L-amino-acid decarboxylase n=1 Tax=Ancylostoma duodenale TaxID=51022 RepID=A0A0C2GVB5_9BILA|nr:pyridoxal-dependent decarboxylase domain protein [Ancylostoma duodenale]
MTELEMATLDWLVDVLGLPEHFKALKNESNSLFSWMASTELGKSVKGILTKVRQNTIEEEESGIIYPYYHDPAVFEKLIAYCSDQAHSSVEKGAMLCGVKLRKLKTTLDPELKNHNVTKEVLEGAIKEDRARGLIPFILIATMGTTSSCSIDRLDSLGPICDREQIWLHVDAAYAGLSIQAVSIK